MTAVTGMQHWVYLNPDSAVMRNLINALQAYSAASFNLDFEVDQPADFMAKHHDAIRAIKRALKHARPALSELPVEFFKSLIVVYKPVAGLLKVQFDLWASLTEPVTHEILFFRNRQHLLLTDEAQLKLSAEPELRNEWLGAFAQL